MWASLDERQNYLRVVIILTATLHPLSQNRAPTGPVLGGIRLALYRRQPWPGETSRPTAASAAVPTRGRLPDGNEMRNAGGKEERAPDLGTPASSGDQLGRMRPDAGHDRPPTPKWRDQRRNPDPHLQLTTRPELRATNLPFVVDYLDVDHTPSGVSLSSKGAFGARSHVLKSLAGFRPTSYPRPEV